MVHAGVAEQGASVRRQDVVYLLGLMDIHIVRDLTRQHITGNNSSPVTKVTKQHLNTEWSRETILSSTDAGTSRINSYNVGSGSYNPLQQDYYMWWSMPDMSEYEDIQIKNTGSPAIFYNSTGGSLGEIATNTDYVSLPDSMCNADKVEVYYKRLYHASGGPYTLYSGSYSFIITGNKAYRAWDDES